MSREEATRLMIAGAIAEHPRREEIEELAANLRRLLAAADDDGSEDGVGEMALALVGAELACADTSEEGRP